MANIHIRWVENWLGQYNEEDLRNILRRLLTQEISIEDIMQNELEGI
jgi:hypothetical protein